MHTRQPITVQTFRRRHHRCGEIYSTAGYLDTVETAIKEGTKVGFHMASVPEFCEGSAVIDTLNPSRVVLGATDQEVFAKLSFCMHRPSPVVVITRFGAAGCTQPTLIWQQESPLSTRWLISVNTAAPMLMKSLKLLQTNALVITTGTRI